MKEGNIEMEKVSLSATDNTEDKETSKQTCQIELSSLPAKKLVH